MGIKIKQYLLFALFSIYLINGYGQSKRILDARARLKKWGIAFCISKTYPNTKIDTLAGNSRDAYFQLGNQTGKAYDEVRKFIEDYLSKNPYMGSMNQDLSLMKCLDLMNNVEYNKLIIHCDKWILPEK